ncbi:MAG: hypothetical protein K6G26_13990 [Lachnospiraceae bacterium]|nr:hypothetical protein [Lachnospiraceae bacterium]
MYILWFLDDKICLKNHFHEKYVELEKIKRIYCSNSVNYISFGDELLKFEYNDKLDEEKLAKWAEEYNYKLMCQLDNVHGYVKYNTMHETLSVVMLIFLVACMLLHNGIKIKDYQTALFSDGEFIVQGDMVYVKKYSVLSFLSSIECYDKEGNFKKNYEVKGLECNYYMYDGNMYIEYLKEKSRECLVFDHDGNPIYEFVRRGDNDEIYSYETGKNFTTDLSYSTYYEGLVINNNNVYVLEKKTGEIKDADKLDIKKVDTPKKSAEIDGKKFYTKNHFVYFNDGQDERMLGIDNVVKSLVLGWYKVYIIIIAAIVTDYVITKKRRKVLKELSEHPTYSLNSNL